MEIEPEILATFKLEFEEQLQIITDGLLRLEKGLRKGARQKVLDEVFRAAHTIKGAAQSVSAKNVAEIAHQVESLFSILRKENTEPSLEWVDLCLEAGSGMREAMEVLETGTSLEFDLPHFLARVSAVSGRKSSKRRTVPAPKRRRSTKSTAARSKVKAAGTTRVRSPQSKKTAPAIEEAPKAGEPSSKSPSKPPRTGTPQGRVAAIRVSADKVDRLGALTEGLQIAKLEIEDHFTGFLKVCAQVQDIAKKWGPRLPSRKGREEDQLPEDLERLLSSSAEAVNNLKSDLARMQNEMRSIDFRKCYRPPSRGPAGLEILRCERHPTV